MRRPLLIVVAVLVVAVASIGVWLYMWVFNPDVKGARVLVIVAERYSHKEYSYVVDALKRQGAEIIVASFSLERVNSLEGEGIEPDIIFEDVKLEDYHAIYIPGGYGMEELVKLAENEPASVLNIVREAKDKNLVVSAICRGTIVLAKASVIEGVKVTGNPAVLEELERAGGIIVDESVVRDGYVVTGKDPYALQQFTKLLLEALVDKLKYG